MWVSHFATAAFGELSQAKERLEELNIDLGWVGTGSYTAKGMMTYQCLEL